MSVNTKHPSHDWVNFDPSEDGENQFCDNCGICSCHSTLAAAQPCTGMWVPK